MGPETRTIYLTARKAGLEWMFNIDKWPDLYDHTSKFWKKIPAELSLNLQEGNDSTC